MEVRNFEQQIYTSTWDSGWKVAASSCPGNTAAANTAEMLIRKMEFERDAQGNEVKVQVVSCNFTEKSFLNAMVMPCPSKDGRPNKLVQIYSPKEKERDAKWVFAPDFERKTDFAAAIPEVLERRSFAARGFTVKELAEHFGLENRLPELLRQVYLTVYGLDPELVFINEKIAAGDSMAYTRDLFQLIYMVIPEWMQTCFSSSSYVNHQRPRLFSFSDHRNFSNCFSLDAGEVSAEISNPLEKVVFEALARLLLSGSEALSFLNAGVNAREVAARGKTAYEKLLWMYAEKMRCLPALLKNYPEKVLEIMLENPDDNADSFLEILREFYGNNQMKFEKTVGRLKKEAPQVYYGTVLAGNSGEYEFLAELFALEKEEDPEKFRQACLYYENGEAYVWLMNKIAEEFTVADTWEKLNKLKATCKSWSEWNNQKPFFVNYYEQCRLAIRAGMIRKQETVEGLLGEWKKVERQQYPEKDQLLALVVECLAALADSGKGPERGEDVRCLWHVIHIAKTNLEGNDYENLCRSLYKNMAEYREALRIYYYMYFYSMFGKAVSDDAWEKESYDRFPDWYTQANKEQIDLTEKDWKFEVYQPKVGYKRNAFYCFCLIMKGKDYKESLWHLETYEKDRTMEFYQFLAEELERWDGVRQDKARKHILEILDTRRKEGPVDGGTRKKGGLEANPKKTDVKLESQTAILPVKLSNLQCFLISLFSAGCIYFSMCMEMKLSGLAAALSALGLTSGVVLLLHATDPESKKFISKRCIEKIVFLTGVLLCICILIGDKFVI